MKAVGIQGARGRDVLNALAKAGITPDSQMNAALAVNGFPIYGGEVDEIIFVEGGVLFRIKEPLEPESGK